MIRRIWRWIRQQDKLEISREVWEHAARGAYEKMKAAETRAETAEQMAQDAEERADELARELEVTELRRGELFLELARSNERKAAMLAEMLRAMTDGDMHKLVDGLCIGGPLHGQRSANRHVQAATCDSPSLLARLDPRVDPYEEIKFERHNYRVERLCHAGSRSRWEVRLQVHESVTLEDLGGAVKKLRWV